MKNENPKSIPSANAECVALYQAIFIHPAGSAARRRAVDRYQKANARRAELQRRAQQRRGGRPGDRCATRRAGTKRDAREAARRSIVADLSGMGFGPDQIKAIQETIADADDEPRIDEYFAPNA